MCVQVEYERYQPEVCVCLCTHPNESVFKYFCFKFGKDVKSVDEGVRDEDCVGGYVGVEDKMLPSAGSVSTSTMLSVPTVFTKNLACHLLEIRKYNNCCTGKCVNPSLGCYLCVTCSNICVKKKKSTLLSTESRTWD